VSAQLERECHSFAWALVSDAPTDPVLEAYERAHAHPALSGSGSRIDRALIRLAAVHPWLARIADAYASMFVRQGLFRTKLVALLAILESGAPHHWRFEIEQTTRIRAWSRLVGWGVASGVALIIGIVVFAPIHLVLALFDRSGHPSTSPSSEPSVERPGTPSS